MTWSTAVPNVVTNGPTLTSRDPRCRECRVGRGSAAAGACSVVWTANERQTSTGLLSAEEVDWGRAELANYDRFPAVSERIVAVNEAICEARPPGAADAVWPSADTEAVKKGSANRSRPR